MDRDKPQQPPAWPAPAPAATAFGLSRRDGAPPTATICRSCEFTNPPAMAFCGRCGQPLAATAQPEFGAQERRQLTVLFCDLVGSTALSERMDLEAFEDLLRRYQEAYTAIARSHNGFVARYVGDALLVYFGYPRALEDAPAQAVRAALAMVAAAATLSVGGVGVSGPGVSGAGGDDGALAVRIGIATGHVVVGDLVGSNMVERAAVRGLAPNLAAKLQAAAEPNSILISAETRRRLPPQFDLRDLGALPIRGLERAEQVFRVTGERPAPSAAFTAQLRGGAAVGRDLELASLLQSWEQARTGHSLCTVVSGEPGIGKSRLLRELRRRTQSGRPATHLRSRAGARQACLVLTCSQNHQDSAFYPIATELRRALRLGPTPAAPAALQRLEALVDAAGLPRAEAVALLAGLLSLDVGSRHPPLALSPPRRRERLFDVLAALLRHWRGGRTLLLLVEDVQWADPSMAEAVRGVLARLAGTPLLCVLSHRPDRHIDWLDALAAQRIALGRLDAACSAGLALAVTGAAALPPATLMGIVERADGVPLFIEELVKNAVEARSGAAGPGEAGVIPASLQESLIARLDRMPDGKAVAQVAAVIGRRFSRALLERVAPIAPAQLRAGLAELVLAGLVSAERDGPGDRYVFHHALVRDTAYATLLLRVRRRLHHDVAGALGADPAAPEGPEILAQHLTLAEDWPAAVAAWLAAGQSSYARLDLAEAMTQFRRGIDLLPQLADPALRRERELALQAGFGAACMLLRGYAAPEVDAAFGRAYALTGDTVAPATFPIIWGVWAFQIASARERFGEAAAHRLSAIASASGDRQLRVLAEAAQAATRGALGDLAGSERAARAAIALYDIEADRHLALAYTMDPKALSLLFLQHVLWIAGRADEADAADTACRSFAEELGVSFVVPYVLIWGGAPLVYAGRHDAAIARMATGVALARAGRLDLWTLTGELWRSAAIIGSGETARGAALLSEQLEAFRVTGVQLAVPYLRALLADALCRLGRVAEALALIEQAVAERAVDGLHAAEIRRLHGDILRAAGQPEAASASYRRALAIARRQGAHAWAARVPAEVNG